VCARARGLGKYIGLNEILFVCKKNKVVRRLNEFNLALLDKWCWRKDGVYGIKCYGVLQKGKGAMCREVRWVSVLADCE